MIEQSLEAVELCALPVSALCVVTDLVASAQADPVRERAVSIAQVAHQTLHTQSLVRTHVQFHTKMKQKKTKQN